MSVKRASLGRGLGALIKEVPVQEGTKEVSEGVLRIPLVKIQKNPWQPRKNFVAEPLNDLIQSIRKHGVLQPLLVRKTGNTFKLIAGERRFRAAQEAALKEIPVIIMDVSDHQALELALIENLQREDLDLIEEAEGYKALLDTFDMTQERVAERVGKGRATIANALRLLALPDAVGKLLAEGKISGGHAKVLLSLEIPAEQELLASRIVRESLSVRVLEKIVAALKRPAKKSRAQRADIPNSHIQYLSERLHQHLGTSVRIASCKTLANGKKTRGSIEIDYYSSEDLGRLVTLLGLNEEI
ncbi:MAG: ParB/RepB/Spo0J family partition protein [Kiritimatiellae bacterium]|nr:ParB/RepB/Spo0J family partition protein [Kiritimatiellia bacterium]